jgi:hypothetical protein
MTETWAQEPPPHPEDAVKVAPGRPFHVPRQPAGSVARNNPPNPAAAADQWVPAGPSLGLHGQATGRPLVAGQVRALAVEDGGRRVYAGSTLGGVWYSDDGGGRWLGLDFHASTKDLDGDEVDNDALTVGAIAVQWGATADDDVVFVGAGEHPPADDERRMRVVRGVGVRAAIGPVGFVRTGGPATEPWRLEATNLAGAAISRLAFDRADPEVLWAATTRGLYRRPADAADRDEWEFVHAGIGAFWVTDVVVLPGLGNEPQRIYAASADGKLVRSTDGTTWQPVSLPAFPKAQVDPRSPVERLALAAGNTPGHAVVFVLGGGPRLWRVDGDAAEIVTGLPAGLFDGQSAYDLAVAAHPATDAAHQDVVVVGGRSFHPPPGRALVDGDAALYAGQVTRVGGVLTFPRAAVAANQPPAEWVGQGIPADVHTLAFAGNATPAQLWVGCDGGVFQSFNDGRRGTFIQRNTGLAAVTARTLAQHPSSAGLLLGGQAGGVARRIGTEAWRLGHGGDAGGVAVDPADGRTMYAQHARSAWYRSVDGGASFTRLEFLSPPDPARPPADQERWTAARAKEKAASRLTGRPALVHDPASARGTQVALGTDRVWYTDDDLQRRKAAGRSGWVTLPAATDPYDPALARPDRGRDRLDGPVLALRWGSANQLYALTSKSVYLVERVAGAWTTRRLYDQTAVHRDWKGKVPSGQIPDNTPLTALAVHDAGRGARGSLYAGTGGPASEQHLWWFDGAGAWKPAGLQAAEAVTAVAVDPAHREVVWAATDAGIFKGTATLGGSPTWTWTRYCDGLPEVACVDLLVHDPGDGGQRLLRAALAGRGVWEVALDSVQQGTEVYLRAHALDTRRGGLGPGGRGDPLHPSGTPVRLDASPDIRLWRANLAAAPAAASLPVGPGSDEYDIWLLQSGLRAAGEQVPTDGVWSADLAAAFARWRAARTPPLPVAATPAQVWDMLWAGNRLPFERGTPDHADLTAHLRERPDRWPKGQATSCMAEDGMLSIYVTVHSRHWKPVASNRVAVALLVAPFGGHGNLAGTPPLPAGWAAALSNDRGAAAGAAGGWLVGSGWAYADRLRPFRSPTDAPDPDNPQVVSFDADLAAPAAVAVWAKRGRLLLAVVVADDDPLNTNETDVGRLVAADRHVAARSLRRTHVLVTPQTRYVGMDVGVYPGLAVMDRAWERSNLTWTGLYLDSPRWVPDELVVPPIAPLVPPRGPARLPVLPDPTAGGHHRWGNQPPPPPVAPPPAPQPPPHTAPLWHAPGGWMRAWAELRPDWGVAPIYWGQQDPRNGAEKVSGGVRSWLPHGPFDLRAVVATANAEDAAAKAGFAGIPKGAVIYADWEEPSVPLAPNALDYYRLFWHRLAELGYRPGAYLHPSQARAFRREAPGLFTWNASCIPNLCAPTGAELSIMRGQAVFQTADLGAGLGRPDHDVLMRQWVFFVPTPTATPARPSPLSPFPDVDVDVAIVGDPAFPERRPQPAEVRGGGVAVLPGDAPDAVAVHAIRRGKPRRSAWRPAAAGAAAGTPGVSTADASLDAAVFPHLWNPFSPVVAVRTPGPTDWLLALGYDATPGDAAWRLAADLIDTDWRVQALERGPGGRWRVTTVPDGGLVVDPLCGVAAAVRAWGVIEAVVVDDLRGLPATARWDPRTRRWSPLAPVAGLAATDTAMRSHRPAAVWRAPDDLDVLWVGADGRLRAARSQVPGVWKLPAAVGDPQVEAHPLGNLVAVSSDPTRIDVLFMGRRLGAANWTLHTTWWTAAAGWGPAQTQSIGGVGIDLDAMARIAAHSRAPGVIDAYAVSDTGRLVTTATAAVGGAWTPLRAIAGLPNVGGFPVFDQVLARPGRNRRSAEPLRLVGVDGSCSRVPGEIEVVATDTDGNVFATYRDAARDYTDFDSVVPLRLA